MSILERGGLFSSGISAGGGGGGIASINGDSTSAQQIVAGSGITVATSSGITTITNSIGWTPALVTPSFWLDASTFSTSGAITTWVDQSATAQSGTGTGTVVLNSQNGKAGVSFNGTTDTFTFNNSTILCAVATPWSAFFVFNCTGFTHDNYPTLGQLKISNGGGATGFVFGVSDDSSNHYKDFHFGVNTTNSDGVFSLTAASPTGAAHRVGIINSGQNNALSNYTAYDAGTAETVSLNGGEGGVQTNNVIGSQSSGHYFYGVIYEIIVVPRVLTGGDLTNMNNYLSSKWGI